jgi:hypothetical protein
MELRIMLRRIDTVAPGAAVNLLPFPCASCSGRPSQRRGLLSALRVANSPVVVDLSGCPSLNHEDIDLLLECMAQVAGRDIQVIFVAGSPANRVLLEVTRIPSLVPVFNSVKEALDYSGIAIHKEVNDQGMNQSQEFGSA